MAFFASCLSEPYKSFTSSHLKEIFILPDVVDEREVTAIGTSDTSEAPKNTHQLKIERIFSLTQIRKLSNFTLTSRVSREVA